MNTLSSLSENCPQVKFDIFKRHLIGKISHDYINAYAYIASIMTMEQPRFDMIKRVPTYEEYFKKYKSENYDYVIQNSDHLAVVHINLLVRLFNNDLERIKRENDAIAIQNFLDKITRVIKQNSNENS